MQRNTMAIDTYPVDKGIRLDNIHLKIKNKHLIKGVSLRLSERGISIILGHNGAGKSLLLRLIHGLISPTQGTVYWDNCAIEKVRHTQAMLFQSPVLLRRSTFANVIYPLQKRRMNKKLATQKATAALERVGLSHLHQQPARTLSGGEQQRIALARALCLEPKLLLLDEPSASLDPSATAIIEQLIGDIANQGCKIIMTTHDLGQARRLASDISFLHAGRLSEQSAAEAFFQRPQSAAGQAYLSGQLPPIL